MTTSVVVALVFLLGGCLNVSITGYSGYNGSSTGSTSAGTTTARGGSTIVGSSSSGTTGTSSSSTGGVASSSSSSSSTGTTGSTFDAGMCGGTGTSLQNDPLGYLPGPGASSISNSADFNGDGLLDVVVSIAGYGGFSVLLGLPDGGLLSSSHFNPSTSADVGPIVAGDVDGDGRPDLLCDEINELAVNTGIYVLLNVDGVLTDPQLLINRLWEVSNFAIGDLDQDGIPDVVDGETTYEGYTVTAFFGLGAGKFSEGTWIATFPEVLGSAPPGTMLLSDLNQDGFPDLVVVPGSGVSQIAVLLRQSSGGYTTSLYTFPGPVIAATLPRSGAAPDLVAAYAGATGPTVQVLSNAGDGTFSMGPTYPLPNPANVPNLATTAIVVGDFDGDCLPDVAVSAPVSCGPTGGSLYVFFGLADGGLQTARSLPPHEGGGGNLAILGPVSTPRALAYSVPCSYFNADAGDSGDVYVYGDASQH